MRKRFRYVVELFSESQRMIFWRVKIRKRKVLYESAGHFFHKRPEIIPRAVFHHRKFLPDAEIIQQFREMLFASEGASPLLQEEIFPTGRVIRKILFGIEEMVLQELHHPFFPVRRVNIVWIAPFSVV